LSGQDAAIGEVQRAGGRPHPDHRRQHQADAGGQQQGQVGARALSRLVITGMRDQWIGRYRQDLVEHEQGEQVVGKGDAGSGTQGDGVAGEEAAQVGIALGVHVADGVRRRQHP
jgi:hypothetical protein